MTKGLEAIPKSNIVNIWHAHQRVGKLWQDDEGKLGFYYEPDWQQQGFAISQQLPLSTTTYDPKTGKAQCFFANLLPEATARQHIVKDLKIPDSDFELLKAIGGECAGALSILPTDLKPNTQHKYKPICGSGLKAILQRKGIILLSNLEKDRPRLSLAGAQDKCPVLLDKQQYFLPQAASPSTHILKFDVTGYAHIPAYEYLLTQLAKRVGLPTVNCEFKTFNHIHYLLIARYDRTQTSDKNIHRLHQEDFCQALGIRYEKKYQQAGGPSFEACYHLVQNVSTHPIIDSENLLKWQIFNVLAGNSDGHAKNLALIYNPHDRIRLAPFYDLVCTRAVDRIDAKLAFSIGGEFNPSNVLPKHWRCLAKNCQIKEQYLMKHVTQMASTLLNNLMPTIQNFEKLHGPYPALQRVRSVITKQCNRVLKQDLT